MRKIRDRTLDASLAQQMKHRIRRAVGVVLDVLSIRASELIPRVKARHLQLTLESELCYRGIAGVEKVVVLDEVSQHMRMNEQRRLALQWVRILQRLQFMTQFFEQSHAGALCADAVAHAIVQMRSRGKRT